MKKPRLGSDPFQKPSGLNALIQDTRPLVRRRAPDTWGGRAADSAAPLMRGNGKHNKLSTLSVHSVQSTSGGQGLQTRSRAAVRTAAQMGLPPDWTRATFIVRKTTLEKLKDRATYRKKIKDIVDQALTIYLRK